jgi:hypothetical protein
LLGAIEFLVSTAPASLYWHVQVCVVWLQLASVQVFVLVEHWVHPGVHGVQ